MDLLEQRPGISDTAIDGNRMAFGVNYKGSWRGKDTPSAGGVRLFKRVYLNDSQRFVP